MGGAVCVIPAMLSADRLLAVPPVWDDLKEHVGWLGSFPVQSMNSTSEGDTPGSRLLSGCFCYSVASRWQHESCCGQDKSSKSQAPAHQCSLHAYNQGTKPPKAQEREQGRPIMDLIAHKHWPEEVEQKGGPCRKDPRQEQQATS